MLNIVYHQMGKRDKMRVEESPTSDPSILNLPLYIVPLSLFPPLGMLGDIKKTKHVLHYKTMCKLKCICLQLNIDTDFGINFQMLSKTLLIRRITATITGRNVKHSSLEIC